MFVSYVFNGNFSKWDIRHAAFVMDIPAGHPWILTEDFVGLRSFRRTGLDLEMPTAEIIGSIAEQYCLYRPNQENISLTRMNLK